jgi:hypothetical protein
MQNISFRKFSLVIAISIHIAFFSGCSSSKFIPHNQTKKIDKVTFISAYKNSNTHSNQDISNKTGLSLETIKQIKEYWHLNNDDLFCMSKKNLRKSIAKINRPKPSFPSEALKFRMESLVNEDGIIPDNAYTKAFAQLKKIPKIAKKPIWGIAPKESLSPELRAIAGIDKASWTWLGPGNIGGRLRSCVIDPVNKNTMWVGSIAGGIWKTTNGGTSWLQEDDFMSNLSVTTMVMDPTDPNIIYAGTGEGFGNSDAIRGAGIFKTSDGGINWNQLPSTSGSTWYYVNRLAINGNGSVLLAATNSELYRSTDGGGIWTTELSGVGKIQDVKFDPNDNLKAVASCTSNNLYYTTDGGLNWNSSSWDYPPTQNPRMELAYSPADANVVWCSMNESNGDLYKSIDGGINWVYQKTTGHLNSQGWYDNVIWVDSTTPNDIYIGGVDLYRYSASAKTATAISRWQASPASAHADHHYITPHPDFGTGGLNDKTVFFCNDGGIYKADISAVNGDSAGTGWTELNNNLGTTQLYGAAGNSTSGIIIGGCQDNGTIAYSGNTETWTEIFGGDGGYCDFDQNDSTYCYGEYVYLAIFRNSNSGGIPADWSKDYINGRYWNGAAWAWKSNPYNIPDSKNSTAEFIAPFMLDPNIAAQTRILGGGLQLWRTNDAKTANTNSAGPSWASIKSSVGSNITAIDVAPGNSDIIWIGHRNGNVYKTANGTNVTPSWTRIDSNGGGLPNRRVQCIQIDKNDNNKVYVTFGGFSTDNVYSTTDAGVADWTSIVGSGATQLPPAPTRTLAIHPDNSNWLYVGTEVGIFASEDGGANWSTTNDGPTNCSVDQLFWMETAGTPVLVAATHGRGIFKISVPNISSGITINDVTVNENSGTATFTVTLTGASAPVSVDYETANNTATAGTDYVAIPTTTLNFIANGTKTFNVTIINDTLNENDETFYINLTNPINTAITKAQGIGTITDNDPEPSVTLSINNATITEAAGVATITATLSAASEKEVTVDLAYSGAATGNGTDYIANTAQIVITAGALTGTATVTAVQDTLDEDNEQVIVDISSITNGTEATPQQVTTTITDDDASPSVTFTAANQASAIENGTLTITLQLSTISGRDISVPFSVNGTSTASVGTDYTITASPVSILKGTTSATITITIVSDNVDEDNETVIVDMGVPTNASQGATIINTTTITDDDTSTISINNVSVTERDTAENDIAQFTVTLSCESSKIITVDYETSNDTATAGTDYVAIPTTTLTFNPGDTTKTIDVTVNGDFDDENDETFNIDLTNPTNATISNAQGIGTIVNDDITYTLTVTNGAGGGPAVVGSTKPIVANPSNIGQTFDKWIGDVANVADVNAATTTIIMQNGNTLVKATYKFDATTAEKITYGSVLKVEAYQITNMDNEFTKRPTIYGKYTDPIKSKIFSSTLKGITKISIPQPSNVFNAQWMRNVALYNKKDLKAANKLGTTTIAWLAADPTRNANLNCNLWAKATTIGKSKSNDFFRGVLIVPPTITSVESWDGVGAVANLHSSSVIIIKGNFFGIKAPVISIEYLDPIGGVAIKQKRLKVLKPYKYADVKGKKERSCMDLTSATGVSEISVELPKKWWNGGGVGNYDLILDNKIGLATFTPIPAVASTTNSIPTATLDAITLYPGDASYIIDVLDNDIDANSDKMTILLANNGETTLKGKVSVSKGKVKYTPPKGILPAAFPDSFSYSLDDGQGATSGTVNVTITMAAITVDPIKHWDGTALAPRTVQPGSWIIITGTNFGVKTPIVTMNNGSGKIYKLKIVEKPEYNDYKGKANKSYTDLSTGSSKLTVELPKKEWDGYANSTPYAIKITNKLDTTGASQNVTTSNGTNSAPTANDDAITIVSGSKVYYLDVLADNGSGADTDAESDKMTIVLTSKTSTLLGAKISVDKKLNKIKYMRVKGQFCALTDNFEYSLIDSNGAKSATNATVTITGNLAP